MNKKMMVWPVLAVFGGLMLAGCADVPLPPDAKGAKTLEKYTPPQPPSAYGEWYIDSYSCTIRARAQDFTLVVEPVPDHGVIHAKAVFMALQARQPTVEISELLAPVPVEGAKRGYGIILAYDSVNAAHMLKDDTFMMVEYQPMNSAEVLTSHFQTRGLMLALADVANYCEP